MADGLQGWLKSKALSLEGHVKEIRHFGFQEVSGLEEWQCAACLGFLNLRKSSLPLVPVDLPKTNGLLWVKCPSARANH